MEYIFENQRQIDHIQGGNNGRIFFTKWKKNNFIRSNKHFSIRATFEEIVENDIQKQIEISRQFFKNFEKREKFITETKNIDNPHVIHFCVPLLPLNEGSNGL